MLDARNIGSAEDGNVRAYWNWRFLFETADVAAIKALLPNSTRYLEQTVDVPLSSTLSRTDCDQLIEAVRKVAAAMRPEPAAAAAGANGR